MVERVETAFVHLWGMVVGALAWDAAREFAAFEFDPGFLENGLDLAPVHMPLAEARRGARRFAFRTLNRATFRGLPGLLADSLPDRFGDALIDAWLARQGRTPADFSPLERLCYTGRRGMGALEFAPPLTGAEIEESVPVEVGELVDLANEVVSRRARLSGNLDENASDTLLDILRVGTSAGGARPKAVIALDEATGAVRSGQVEAPPGFAHWILKFDGVHDTTLDAPTGHGRIEYAYSIMARDAGIEMEECRLLEEGGRAHFMTRRFDRPRGGGKLHLQSLCAVGHYDFNEPRAHSYEQAFQVMRRLGLPHADAEQQFRRMAFNIVARNQDDHTKNIAFLMNRRGEWRLSPAFDVTHAYNPRGDWTSRHQMSVGGKRDDFTRRDLLDLGREMSIKSAAGLVEQVVEAVAQWPVHARAAGVPAAVIEAVGRTHRLLP